MRVRRNAGNYSGSICCSGHNCFSSAHRSSDNSKSVQQKRVTAVNQFLLYASEYVRKPAPRPLAVSIIYCFSTERERTEMSISLFSFILGKNAQQKPCAKVSIKQPYSVSLRRETWSLNWNRKQKERFLQSWYSKLQSYFIFLDPKKKKNYF